MKTKLDSKPLEIITIVTLFISLILFFTDNIIPFSDGFWIGIRYLDIITVGNLKGVVGTAFAIVVLYLLKIQNQTILFNFLKWSFILNIGIGLFQSIIQFLFIINFRDGFLYWFNETLVYGIGTPLGLIMLVLFLPSMIGRYKESLPQVYLDFTNKYTEKINFRLMLIITVLYLLVFTLKHWYFLDYR